MNLTPTQKTTLKAAVLTDPFYIDGNLSGLAGSLNAIFSPDYWVWRTDVTRQSVYNTQDWEGNTWNWTTYKNQGQAEQAAWLQMFMPESANFSQQNIRDGVASIFAGSAQANAQRDHVLSIGRRKATHLEHIFAVGLGTTASPSIMTIEGIISYSDLVGINTW